MKGSSSVLLSIMMALSLGSCSSNGVNTLLGSNASLKLRVSLQALVSGTTFTISLKRDGQNLAPPQTLGPFNTLEEALAGVRNGVSFGTVSPGPATLDCRPAASDGGSQIDFVIQPGENNVSIRCGAPVAAPIITAFDPKEGDVGTEVTLIGNNFIDIEAVKFNGIPSEFKVISPTEIQAIVPEGASTGLISVETRLPNGDLVIGSSDPNPFFIGSEVRIETITQTAVEPTNSEQEGTPATVRITRQGSTAEPLVVRYRVAGSAVAGVDYEALLGSVTIPAGSESIDLEIVPLFDGVLDPDETVDIILNSSNDYRIGDPGSARVFISDSGTLFPTARVEATKDVIEEGEEGEFIIVLSDIAREDVEINFDLKGTASEGVDYELFSPGILGKLEVIDRQVVIPSGQSSVRVIVDALEDESSAPTPGSDDGELSPRELDETVQLTVLAGDGYTVGDPSSAEITILNRDRRSPVNQAPQIQIISLPNARVNLPYSTTIQATDPEGGDITFSATGLPRGLTLSSSGILSGTPDNIAGFFTVQITARDPDNRSTTVALPFAVNYRVLINQPNVIFSSGVSSTTLTATLADGYTPEGGNLVIDIVVASGSGSIQVNPATLIFNAGVNQQTFDIIRLDPNPFSGTEIDFFTGNSTASNVLFPAGVGPFAPRPIIRVSGQ
jgi:hypothetical protein